MSSLGRILKTLLFVLPGPTAGWLLVRNGLAAWWVGVLMVVLVELLMAVVLLFGAAVNQAAKRRAEQVVDFFDLALGRKVSRYARHYRRYVLERDSHINARDLAHAPSHIPELDAVYVDVGLAPGSPSTRSGGLLPGSRAKGHERHQIHDFLDRPTPAVCAVIGAPGSGKSTLLRHTARRCASQGRSRRRTVPVMVALRDHAEAITSDPSLSLADLIRSDVGRLAITEPAGWWEAQLRRGDCLLLFDGLDEVARREDRTAVAEWIEKQIAKHSRNDFLVTSRPHGYQTAVIPQATVLQVRPFTTDQIRQFVHGWCRAAEQLATGASGPEIDKRAEEEADDMIGQLLATPALIELAVNPLLLTMMVLVHRERRALPAGRADLYHQVCDVMLWRRQESKKLDVKPPGPVRQRILGSLAYAMMVAETPDFLKDEVLAVFDRSLQQLDAEVTAEELLAAIVESSGLLVEREKDRFAFAHHTIGEYLAAMHIRAHGLEKRLVEAVGDPWWRETTLLYVTDADANAIVEECLRLNTGTSLSLAFDCVRSHGQLRRGLRDVLNRLRAQAFEADADLETRRHIASAIAAGHLSRLVTSDQGTMVCSRPVPMDLYALFCMDTGLLLPAEFGDFDPVAEEQPAAIGMWAGDVDKFLFWLHGLIRFKHAGPFRLTTPEEAEFLARRTPDLEKSETPQTVPWIAPSGHASPKPMAVNGRSPSSVSHGDIRTAVEADLTRTPLTVEILRVNAQTDAVSLTHMIRLALASHHGESFPPSPAAVLLLAKRLQSDLGMLTVLTEDPAQKRHLAPDCDLRELATDANMVARMISEDRISPFAEILAKSIADRLDLETRFSSAFNLTAARFRDRHRVETEAATARHERALGWALSYAMSELAQRNPSGKEIISALGKAFQRALDPRRFRDERQRGISPGGLFGTFAAACDMLLTAEAAGESGMDSWASTVTSHLSSKAAPVLNRTAPATDADLANFRVGALLLAAEAESLRVPNAAERFRDLAAGFTLLSMRKSGQVPLEVIMLARD